MHETDLRKMQLIQLEMLTEFDRICRKYEIEYFIIAGTLLGAVRHGGFIPWDDDVDVAMKRESMKNFAKFAEKNFHQREYFCRIIIRIQHIGGDMQNCEKRIQNILEKVRKQLNVCQGFQLIYLF